MCQEKSVIPPDPKPPLEMAVVFGPVRKGYLSELVDSVEKDEAHCSSD